MANEILRPGDGMMGDEIDVKQKSLFARLKKMFAAGSVIRNVGGKKIVRKDTSDLQYATDRNIIRDRFNRVRSTSYNAYTRDFSLAYQAARIDLFRDYDTMDMDPILASALDIYADECLTINEMGKVLVVHAEDDNIKGILTNLFYDVLNIEHNLWSWTRNTCKYGDFYMRLYISPEYGVYQVEPISAYNVERLENTDPLNKNYVKFQIRPTDTSQVETLESFECAHFRLLSDSNFLPYGKSMIESARRVWKQLSLLEDAMLINRIMRAPERRIFKIDIGNIPPQDVDAFMEKMISKTKKVPYIDQQTGDYNLRFNLMNMVEDFYLPVRGVDSGTSIDTLSGIEWTGIDDIEYVRNKMMAALKIPKAFLGYEEELCIRKNTKIPLLDGNVKTVEDLIKDYENGIKNFVYSIDETTKNIVPGEIEWAGFTRKNAELIRVWLDNNKYIDCTPDHNFLTRDGQWIEAQNLKYNQSLMPLYVKKEVMFGKSDYEKVYNPSTETWEWTHQLVDNCINGNLVQPQKINENKDNIIVRHHKDFNRFNNNPNNLERLSFKEHKKIHKENVYKTFCSPEAIAYKKSDEFRKKKSLERLTYIKENPQEKERLKKNLAQYNFTNEELSILCENGWKKDTGTRKEKLIKNNLKYDKIFLMRSAKRIKSGLTNSLPTFNELIYFSTQNGYNTKKAAESLKCGIHYIHNLIYENGYNSINDFSEKYNVKNHKVIKVEWLTEREDTCDIRIKSYHNFATQAGVFIHNSGKATLASEDVRFARTIQRIQRILISELEKIAIVHLYAQGYRDESLVNFKIELTNPSTIFEKEKIEIWSNKVEVASRMMEIKLFPKSWVYKNVFNLSEDDVDGLQDNIVEDSKQLYRFRSIEEEGNDPAQPFKKINPNVQPGQGGSGGMPPGDLGSPLGGGLGGGGLGDLGSPGGMGGPGGGAGTPLMEESEETGSIVYETPIKPAPLPTIGEENLISELPNQPDPQSPTDNGLAEEQGEHSEEWKRNRPSQSGNKDARKDYPFGEDPLGNIENNSKPRPGRSIIHKFAKNSPLALEAERKANNIKRINTMKKGNIITSLDAYLSKKGSEKKNLIKESDGTKSIMDPDILIDE